MNEEIKNAVVELENWLSDPQELGKKPVKIEYANSFEDEDDTDIYFNRTGGVYELVLQKNEITGEWERPNK